MPPSKLVPILAVLVIGLAPAARAQTMNDPNLVVDSLVPQGLSSPVRIAFLGVDDFFVLLKGGTVVRVKDGVLLPDPVLTVNTSSNGERGLLGIAIDHDVPRHVFVFNTEVNPDPQGEPINRVYRYDWDPESGTLVNPLLLLDLPTSSDTGHNGGALVIGPQGEVPGIGDGSLLYIVIGDLQRDGQLENFASASPPDDTSVILRVRGNGEPAPGNPFHPYCSETTTQMCDQGIDCPLGEFCRSGVARYYAYGVRNSFGLAIDPKTGWLWDTENGQFEYDEVNRVLPGMNSGWERVMGPIARDPEGPADLFNFPGKGSTYKDPEFSWRSTIAPTGIVVPFHSSLGRAYDHVVLVADFNFGRIHALPLNGKRTAFDVTAMPGLQDLVADNPAEVAPFVIGEGFNQPTDLEIGPDGHLYIVTIFPPNVWRVRGPRAIPALPGVAPFALFFTIAAGALIAIRLRARSDAPFESR